jgi:hypothetical protein
VLEWHEAPLGADGQDRHPDLPAGIEAERHDGVNDKAGDWRPGPALRGGQAVRPL